MPRQDDNRMEAVECSLLTEPEAALAWRRALIRQARHAIDAQYYSWEEDDSGSQLLAELLAAARRGVQVRLLVDDMYVVTSGWLALLAGEPNVAVRLFNPFRFRLWRPLALLLEILLRFRRLNHRMHNKLLLIDGRLAIVGGRNMGDSYFDRSASTAFIDLDLLCRGILCRQLEQGFVRFWRSRWSRSLLRLHPELGTMSADERARRCAALLSLTGQEGEPPAPIWWQGEGRVLFDVPGKGILRPGRVAGWIDRALQQAGPRLVLVSPYLLLPPRFMRRLRRLARRGCEISVLTNSMATTDVPLVQATYEQQRERLRRLGIALHELRPDRGRSLHAKLVLTGSGEILLGSFNLDPRSLFLNTELVVRLRCEPLQEALQQWVAGWQQESWPQHRQAHPPLPCWRRAWRWLAGRLPIQRWL